MIIGHLLIWVERFYLLAYEISITYEVVPLVSWQE